MLVDIIDNLIQIDPTQRLTMEQAMQHPFVATDTEDYAQYLEEYEEMN